MNYILAILIFGFCSISHAQIAENSIAVEKVHGKEDSIKVTTTIKPKVDVIKDQEAINRIDQLKKAITDLESLIDQYQSEIDKITDQFLEANIDLDERREIIKNKPIEEENP